MRALRHGPRLRYRPSGTDLDLRRGLLHGPRERLRELGENQYQLRIYQAGVFKACGKNGVCGEVQADK